jgi:hypothetical protein
MAFHVKRSVVEQTLAAAMVLASGSLTKWSPIERVAGGRALPPSLVSVPKGWATREPFGGAVLEGG